MVRKFSEALGSMPEAFSASGVFDGFIEVDTKLYIDPHLLLTSSAPEIREASLHFRGYFEDIIRILRRMTSIRKDALMREVVRRLTFHENPLLSLGYSANNTIGSAIGPGLANSIAKTAFEIVIAGIEDPEIFELIGLLEEGIGADRISDMTAAVIIGFLYSYSQRIATELGLSTNGFEYKGQIFQLPFDKNTLRYVVLIPQDILRKLPVANDWSDIDIVCAHNIALRRQVNRIIGTTWRNATKKVSKEDLRRTLIGIPDLMRDLIDVYKEKEGLSYDFKKDPAGEFTWHDAGHDYANDYPLDLSHFGVVTADNVMEIVLEICNRFKSLVEANGLFNLFYDDNDKLKNERAAQLLFFGVADAYCEANNLDLSREPNAGRGPVDFKVSRGYKARVNVEIKYSSNPNLRNGYEVQLPTYNLAEKTSTSILLVIQTRDNKDTIEDLYQLKEEATAQGMRSPTIIVVDGRKVKSASKLRRKRPRRRTSLWSSAV